MEKPQSGSGMQVKMEEVPSWPAYCTATNTEWL